MLSTEAALTLAERLVTAALRAGATAADAAYAGESALDVQMRLGMLEDVQRAEGATATLRVFDGQRVASVSSADTGDDALDRLVERAVTMARAASPDPYATLAPEALLARDTAPAFDLDDGGAVDPERLRALALAAEDAARAVPGVTNSEGASAGSVRGVTALVTSHGFAGAYTGSRYGIGASVLAGKPGAMERDSASHVTRHLADLEDAAAIGTRAGSRAVARLGPVRPGSGAMPVVFDPRIGGSLIGHLLGAIAGSAIARRTSFLLDKRGAALFAPDISIIDDPHRPRGLRSRGFDGEGVATARRALIDRGVLTGWMLESASARQLGEAPTGHAARSGGSALGVSASNVHMAPGTIDPAALMADIRHGIYVTDLIGQGVNPVTGDYSRGAGGFVIRDGALAEPVNEITIAGNLLDMFAAIVPANDLEMRRAVNVPTLRIDGMTVAGG